MRDGPAVDLGEVVLVDEFSEGLAIIVADVFSRDVFSGGELRQVGDEIVAAAPENSAARLEVQ